MHINTLFKDTATYQRVLFKKELMTQPFEAPSPCMRSQKKNFNHFFQEGAGVELWPSRTPASFYNDPNIETM